MRLPRLRIAHQLALLLTAAVVLAVLAVGALGVWNLRSGFTDYMRTRDDEQLTRFVRLLERHAAADPSMAWIRDDESKRALMDEFNGRPARDQRLQPPPGRQRPPPFDRGDRDSADPLPPPPPRAPPPPGNFAERVTILDLRGQHLAGRPQAPEARRTVRAVKVDGVEVAQVELAAESAPDGMDARFLQRQYAGLASAGLGTVIVVVLMGWWVAGRWSRPLRELQEATRRIARGEKAVQIPAGNTPDSSLSGAVEIDQLISDVNAMAIALAALEETRRTWIAQISHDLRTPLAVLRGELESIEDGARQPTPAVVRSLCEEVVQLNRMVDDLHTLAMADLGDMPCEFVSGDANQALHRIAAKFEPRARQLGIALAIETPQGVIDAYWDFGRIEQLLSNLLENSLRYTSAPGRILVCWQAGSQDLQLLVDDSQPGVAPGDLPKLFEPLFRGDASRTRTGQHGSGLGLSIVRAITRAHRGLVVADASPLGGVRVRVVLPLNPQRYERRRREP